MELNLEYVAKDSGFERGLFKLRLKICEESRSVKKKTFQLARQLKAMLEK
jgi:hypothetical protein